MGYSLVVLTEEEIMIENMNRRDLTKIAGAMAGAAVAARLASTAAQEGTPAAMDMQAVEEILGA